MRKPFTEMSEGYVSGSVECPHCKGHIYYQQSGAVSSALVNIAIAQDKAEYERVTGFTADETTNLREAFDEIKHLRKERDEFRVKCERVENLWLNAKHQLDEFEKNWGLTLTELQEMEKIVE